MSVMQIFRRAHAADEAVIAAALDGMTIEPERTLLETSARACVGHPVAPEIR